MSDQRLDKSLKQCVNVLIFGGIEEVSFYEVILVLLSDIGKTGRNEFWGHIGSSDISDGKSELGCKMWFKET